MNINAYSNSNANSVAKRKKRQRSFLILLLLTVASGLLLFMFLTNMIPSLTVYYFSYYRRNGESSIEQSRLAHHSGSGRRGIGGGGGGGREHSTRNDVAAFVKNYYIGGRTCHDDNFTVLPSQLTHYTDDPAERRAVQSRDVLCLEEESPTVPWWPSLTKSSSGSVLRSREFFPSSSSASSDGGDPPAVKDAILADPIAWRVLSPASPRALTASSILTPEECESLIRIASPHLAQNTVGSGTAVKTSNVRTSHGMFMNEEKKGLHAPANRKLHDAAVRLTGAVDLWLEATQILRYDAGTFYKPHHDYFGDLNIVKKYGDRIGSMITTLSPAASGGETSFPNSLDVAEAGGGGGGGGEAEGRGKSGEGVVRELRHKGKQGEAVLFYNYNLNGTRDSHSLHAGLPPTQNTTKWVAVLWIHNRDPNRNK